MVCENSMLWSADLCDAIIVIQEPHGDVLCEEQVRMGYWGGGRGGEGGKNGGDGWLECLESDRGLV